MDRGRRAFLRGGFLTKEGRTEYARSSTPLGPVFPWHRGEAMYRLCAECARPCVEACPEKIIRVHGEDHALHGVPYLTFEQGACTWCAECVKACPVAPVVTPDRPKLGQVAIETGTCHAWNGVVCISCVSRCEYRALRRDGQGRVTVDESACTGCGACMAVCPAPGALVYHAGPPLAA